MTRLRELPPATWRTRATVLAHLALWVGEWGVNVAKFFVFLVRRRRIQAEMRSLILDPNAVEQPAPPDDSESDS